jgi:hypothetical protein
MNLVPNPSFEDTIACPTNLAGQYGDQIYNLTNWFPAGNSPDYFNICSNINVSIPFNYFGYQFPLSGNGYVGLYTLGNFPTIPNYREYVGVELKQSMVVGTKYYLKMAVCAAYSAYNFINSISNNMGIKLSSLHYESLNNPLIPDNLPTLNYNTIISDSINWKTINFSYVADSSYEYMYLGNFYDDSNTDTLICPGETFSYGAYYYIDNICISTDSSFCETILSTKENNEIEFSISPNPSNNIIQIISLTEIQELRIFNLMGSLIKKIKGDSNVIILNNSDLSSGNYLIQIFTKNQQFNSKIIQKL